MRALNPAAVSLLCCSVTPTGPWTGGTSRQEFPPFPQSLNYSQNVTNPMQSPSSQNYKSFKGNFEVSLLSNSRTQRNLLNQPATNPRQSSSFVYQGSIFVPSFQSYSSGILQINLSGSFKYFMYLITTLLQDPLQGVR